MFSELVTWYLFLGGAGSGLLTVLAAADLAFGRARRRAAAEPGRISWTDGLGPRPFASGLPVAAVCLALGALCLLADLGRAERFFLVFALPSSSVLTLGAYALLLTFALAAALAAVSAFGLAGVPARALAAIEAAAVVCGLTTAAYTGALLAQTGSTALWNPALPVLFLASSLAVGAAAAALCAAPLASLPARLLRALARLDAAALALELAGAVAWVAWTCARAGVPAVSGALCAGGAFGAALWGGFALCGLLVPTILGVVGAARPRLRAACMGLAPPFVLIGGFFLRYCAVNAPLL